MSDERDPSNLPAGAVFGRYNINRKIGSGALGSVYEATHLDLKKRVAVKVLHRDAAASPEVKARFLREGEAASRIRHPHVVNVTDFGVEGDVPYLVMEYLEGETLQARIDREGPLPVSETADIVLAILAAVGAAHEVGVIHRDLKPENIFLKKSRQGEPEPKVVDFGISKLKDMAMSLTGTNAVFGSPHYMPPEQMVASKNVEPRSDQYAIGVILYECLTGQAPFDARQLTELMKMVMSNKVTPPTQHRADIPAPLEAAILKAMAKRPEDRFADVYALGRELLPFAGERAQLLWSDEFNSRAPDAGRKAEPASALSASATGSSGSGPSLTTASGSTSSGAGAVPTSAPPVRASGPPAEPFAATVSAEIDRAENGLNALSTPVAATPAEPPSVGHEARANAARVVAPRTESSPATARRPAWTLWVVFALAAIVVGALVAKLLG